MEINNINVPYLKSLPIDSKLNLLKEGNIVEGEILDIEGSEAVIYIEGLGKIRANIQMELDGLMGKEIDFLIKSKSLNEIQLKPILNSIEKGNDFENINPKDIYLMEILNESGVEGDAVSIEYLNDLMEYNVPINEENILSGIRILNKLEQLIDIDEEKCSIINLEGETEIQKVDIRNILIGPKELNEDSNINSNLLSKKDIRELEKIIEKTDIDENNMDLKFKENKDRIFIEDLKLKTNVNLKNGIDSSIIKTIALFVKYNIKASINNIKYFLELNKAEDVFLNNLELLQEDLKFEKFTISDKRAMINSEGFKNIIEENYVQHKILLKEIVDYVNSNSNSIDKNKMEILEELQSKLDFLEELNHEFNFIYIPLFLNNNYDNAITLLKDKKNKSVSKDKINVFISLNTNNLGNIKIFCEALGNILNIKFNGVKKDDIILFENRKEELKIAILNTGYTIGDVKYLVEDNKNGILDLLIENKNPVYYLDIEV